MYTKDSPAYGGFLDKDGTLVNWKDPPLREISCSRTNVEDKMIAACAVGERTGGSISAYGERNQEEGLRTSTVEFCDRHWSLNGDERLEFDGRWMMDSQSDGKTASRYASVRSTVMPSLVNAAEAKRGRKRKVEESGDEDDWFREKYAGVSNGKDRCSDAVIRAKEDYQCTASVGNPESFHDDQAAGQLSLRSTTASSSNKNSTISCSKEVSGRFIRSAMTSSHIPGQFEKRPKLEKTGGRFVRTSMRGSFHVDENEPTRNLSPVEWWRNSANSTNCGSRIGLKNIPNIPAEMLELPRKAIPFHPHSDDRVVRGLLQSSEILQSNLEAANSSPKSNPVLSDVSPTLEQSFTSAKNKESSTSKILLSNSAIPPRPLFNKSVDEATLHNSASKFRQTSPPSKNEINRIIYVTSPDNSLTQILVLPPSDLRESTDGVLHKSPYGCNTSLPLLERPIPQSEERQSEERLWRNLEASCKQDLLDAVRRRSKGFANSRYDPFSNNHPVSLTDYTLQRGLSSSGNMYSSYNVQVPECFTAAVPPGRMTVQKEMPQQYQTVQEFPPTTGTYKMQADNNDASHSTEMQIRDTRYERTRLVCFGRSPPVHTLEMNNRWVDCQPENPNKLLHRSKSLSPSIKSNVQSGNFGSLQSIRTYYKALGKSKPSLRRETRTAREKEEADSCCDAQQFIESNAGEADVPIDLSSGVRKRERNVVDGVAISGNTTDANTDCIGRRNTKNLGGFVPETRCVRSPAPGTILLAPKSAALDSGGVDISERFPPVPSPSVSQQSSRLSSPAGMPDSHLPPKKRRMPNYLSPVIESPSLGKDFLKAFKSPDLKKSPSWSHVPVSVEESLELETKAQMAEKTELPERHEEHYDQWPENALENPEDVRWAVTPDEDGDLPLHIGVARGSESYVRKCVGIMSRLGASLDVYDSNRKTALQIAVITSQLNIVDILLRASASPNVCDRSGANSVHLAVKYEELDCLKCLLTQSNHVLDLDARNYEGLTALHLAVTSNQLDAARILLLAGAGVNVADGKTGQTPLHYAAERNSHQMAKLLLVCGANPSTTSYSGCTPAQVASAKSQLEMAKMLERSTFSLSNGPLATGKIFHVKEQ